MDLKSILGYADNSPFRSNPYLDIHTPEGFITMENTSMDIMGIDNFGNSKKMKAGRKKPYKFKGDIVREVPYQKGGAIYDFLFGDDEEEEDIPTAPDEEEIIQEGVDFQRVNSDEEEYQQSLQLAMETRGRNPYLSNTTNNNVNTSFGNPYTESSNSLNPDSYLNAIFGNEGGKTGVDPAIRGTASGKYAIIKSGRKDLYNMFWKDTMTYDQFEKQYNSNPNFEYSVARKLAELNIGKSKTSAEAIGRWYSPQHASTGQWNTVPRPDYGNKLTVKQYVDRALKNYK